MKDYRRQGGSVESLDALLLTHMEKAPLPFHGRLGCVQCAIETGRFFVYTDMLVCIYCDARYGLKDPIFPQQEYASKRCVCSKCHGFHWWVERQKIYCKCGGVKPTAAVIQAVPLFDYAELPEPVTFGMDAKTEIKRSHFDD